LKPVAERVAIVGNLKLVNLPVMEADPGIPVDEQGAVENPGPGSLDQSGTKMDLVPRGQAAQEFARFASRNFIGEHCRAGVGPAGRYRLGQNCDLRAILGGFGNQNRGVTEIDAFRARFDPHLNHRQFHVKRIESARESCDSQPSQQARH
jgi:hypothetical protein